MSAKKLLIAALSSAALAAPFDSVVEERQEACAPAWGQCGGQGWTGATCCASGSACVASSEWYHQCLPGAAATTSSTTSRSSTTAPAPSTSSTTRPTVTVSSTVTTSASIPVGSGTASWTGNPFSGVKMWANSYYASEVSAYAVPTLGPGAAAVAEVPSFQWLDTRAKVPLIAETLADIRKANQAGANPPYAGIFVVYDLPDRDCAAAASNGEYAIIDGGVQKYKEYIDAIVELFKAYSDIRLLLVIEPDSLANMVTNLNVAKCANARSAYEECSKYAIQNLDLPNVAMYLDAGHAGWLGWQANLEPAAQMYAQLYKDTGSPKALRGLATNVANYNAWKISSCPSYTQGNTNCDEERYVNALGPLLSANGWDAHFITDTGRSGKQPTGQLEWGHWCNVIGTGFGPRPSADTGHELLDAFVWIKPGGECDGTSDTTAARYDSHCGLADALKPAPEAGAWFQAYFEQLYNNANPSFQ
ncbi:carbohydrate-binding module family 1 [Durotheca rogersii]|uniref:carbohydrate-binding module family 1 n=1 Tax=Durotheca rogersii TaxID=419775 RepID=UPI00221ED259|nr:carbohydrate-binding module family 1 [Durotheca rogersii]KAI5865268.1 carbohydrate-binding module family 1 [Durotheca rogersii]